MGKKTDEKMSPGWFLGGLAAGVGAWFLYKGLMTRRSPVGGTVAAPMPGMVPPGSYPSLDAVAVRLDELKTLYRSGRLTPDQAGSELDRLAAAANGFSLAEGERVNEVLAAIDAFRAQIEDYQRSVNV